MSKAAAMISCVEVDFVCIIAMARLAHKAVGVGFDRPIKNKLFERALWFAVAACVMEVIWDIHADGYITLRQGVGWLVNAAYFMCLELSAFAWFIYAEVVENKNIPHNRRRFLLSSIPQWVLAALLLASAFNGWIFSVDEAGAYHRGAAVFCAASVFLRLCGLHDGKEPAGRAAAEKHIEQEGIHSHRVFRSAGFDLRRAAISDAAAVFGHGGHYDLL